MQPNEKLWFCENKNQAEMINNDIYYGALWVRKDILLYVGSGFCILSHWASCSSTNPFLLLGSPRAIYSAFFYDVADRASQEGAKGDWNRDSCDRNPGTKSNTTCVQPALKIFTCYHTS